jgi:hypothetical protein
MNQCSATVYPNDRWGSFHGYRCNKKAVVERDGKFYCKVHDPEYKAKKQAEASARFDMIYETRKTQWHRDKVIARIFDNVPTEVIEERANEIRKLLEEK